LKTYIVDVRRTNKGPQIMVSRTHPGLLKRLFELEVPEIYEGLVEIKAVAREAGQRSKVAVESNDANVDPVGACVGAKGSRVRMIVSELRGEKVDIVEWKEDPAEFIANAISPAKVKEVLIDPRSETAEVVVPDNQLSLAIGKEGQNARLAAKMTGWRIDILSESQATDAASRRAELELQEEVVEDKERQCRAITASEKRCRNKTLPGSDFCGIPAHQKLAKLLEQGSEQIEEYAPVEDVTDKTEVAGDESANDSGSQAKEKSEADVGKPAIQVTEAAKDDESGEPRTAELKNEEVVTDEGTEAEESEATDVEATEEKDG
jgi:N utilization substance protein A